MEDIGNTLIYDLVIPIAVILAVKMGMMQLYTYMQSLWVSGKPNEWVLIMNNGKMVQAGVGLCTFKSPFDQVATFPARVYKVEFSTEQVTNEMQGVRVCGMLVWTVNRVGDGPFNAYKNLGDISSGNPQSANESLVAMSTSVVRSCIANSTMMEMMRNRQLLREAIKKEMFEVVKGWGVWLETVEITNVTICSSSLFKDLQTNYRESMRQQATLFQMQVKEEIDQVKSQNNLEVAEKEREIQEKKRVYVSKVELERKEADEKFLREKMEILKEKEQLLVVADIFESTEAQTLIIAQQQLDLKQTQAQNQMKIAIDQECQRLTKETQISEERNLKYRMEREKIEKDANNEIQKSEMELKKANMDENMLKYEAFQLAKKCYNGKKVERTNLTTMDQADASGTVLAGLLNKLNVTKQAIGHQ